MRALATGGQAHHALRKHRYHHVPRRFRRSRARHPAPPAVRSRMGVGDVGAKQLATVFKRCMATSRGKGKIRLQVLNLR